MRFRLTACVAVAAIAAAAQSADEIRMNQIQVLGSHNSYKQAIDDSLWTLLTKNGDERLQGLEYWHAPVEKQLDMGLRGLEIDVVYDPKGGLYAHPKGIDLVKDAGMPAGPRYDPEGMMQRPGFKVMHVPDIDFRANVYTFRQELALLKAWSDAHPRHLPIAITMNAKDSGLDQPGFVKVLKFDKAAYDAWDAELLEGLGHRKLITPNDVRGSYPTLEAAVKAQAWPTLAQARGKFLFMLNETGDKMEMYIEGHPSLKGRVMFVNAKEGRAEAAFRIVNEPQRDWAYIQYLVRSGYFVRTRADADTVEARKGDYSRLRMALVSGAQIVSTDYYLPETRFHTGYVVHLQPAWNPLLLPESRPLPSIE